MTLLEQFESLTIADLDNYISAGQEEYLYLDFKTINRADLSHNDDKKNLAKALSGFANSGGGLIVWGIEARKNNKGIDCASGKQVISPLPLFISRLNELTGEAASPMVDGVRHRPILSNSDEGFAVTLIPESDSGPHMAKLGEDRYYKRSGDSFYRMEHFDLEDMFGRRKKPMLSFKAKVVGIGINSEIIIGIENKGRGTAKSPYLAFYVSRPFRPSRYGLYGSGGHGLPKLQSSDSQRHRYGANSSFVIHPGTIHEVTMLDLGQSFREENVPDNVSIEYEITAEDIRAIKGNISLQIQKS